MKARLLKLASWVGAPAQAGVLGARWGPSPQSRSMHSTPVDQERPVALITVSQEHSTALRPAIGFEQSGANRSWLHHAFANAWGHAPLLLAISSLLWSGNFIVARAIHGTISSLDLSFLRWLAALALIVMPACRHLRQDFTTLLRHWRIFLVMAVFGIAAMNTLIYRGLQSTTALNALLLQSVAPLLVLGAALALYGEQPRPQQIIAVLISLLGVATVAVHGNPVAVWHSVEVGGGDVWVIGGVLCYALYAALLRCRPVVHAISLFTTCVAIGLLLLLPLVVWEHLAGVASIPTGRIAPAIAYLALFPSIIAFLCFNRGVELIGPNRAGHYVHLMPVFGSLLAVAFLGERLHPYHVAAAALIAGGLLLASRTSPPKRPAGSGPSGLVQAWHPWRLYSRRTRQRQ